MRHWPTGMTKARTPSVLPFRVVLMYMRPLFKTRLADTEEHLALFHLSLCSKVLLEKGVPPWKWHVLPETEPLVACGQGSICLLGLPPVYDEHRFKLCHLYPCLLAQMLMLFKSSSLALASLWLVAPTIAPSRRDWMVSQLWLMGTRLNASAAPLLVPFWYS